MTEIIVQSYPLFCIPSTNPVLRTNLAGATFAGCKRIGETPKNRCTP